MNLGAKRIKEYLDKREMTQEAFATAIEVTPANVSRIINGLQRPSIVTAMKIKAVTDGYVAPDDFVKPGCEDGVTI